jgi:hypothetical protein
VLTPRVSTIGETRSFTKSKAIDSSTARNAQELYSLAKAQEFQLLVKLLVSPRVKPFSQ